MTSSFNSNLSEFYKKNKRDLPWRNTRNPYNIFISEVMLQQTQVNRVLQKYQEFIKVFPDFNTLSKNSFQQILRLWHGLGYNRRALYLQKSAQIVVTDFNGKVPKDPIILQTLPGIGAATASSIVVFSYNIPHVFIETNVRRVFIHHFFCDLKDITDKQLYPLIEKELDHKNPREWYYALMDYGTFLSKTIENPNRKSRHYTKQSQFEGSIRQIRGKILKHLLSVGKISEALLFESLDGEQSKNKIAFDQLLNEGMIVKIKDTISLST